MDKKIHKKYYQEVEDNQTNRFKKMKLKEVEAENLGFDDVDVDDELYNNVRYFLKQ